MVHSNVKVATALLHTSDVMGTRIVETLVMRRTVLRGIPTVATALTASLNVTTVFVLKRTINVTVLTTVVMGQTKTQVSVVSIFIYSIQRIFYLAN